MRLLDVAKTLGTEGGGGARFPREADSRACAVLVTVEDVCPPHDPVEVVAGAGDGDTYEVEPFAITAELARRVSCSREDDESFLRGVLDAKTDAALGMVLSMRVSDLAAPPVTSVAVARTMVTGEYAGEVVLNVQPEDLPQLVKDKIVQVSKNGREHYTVWGDPVAISDGYAVSFWSGPIAVGLSSIEIEEGRDLTGNRIVLKGNRLAAIVTDPCALVALDLS